MVTGLLVMSWLRNVFDRLPLLLPVLFELIVESLLHVVEHICQLDVSLHVFVVCPKSGQTDFTGGAGLNDVADDVGVVVASQMVRTDGNCYLKSLCGNWMTFVSCFFYFVLVGVVC